MLAARLKQFFDKYQVAYLEMNHERRQSFEETILELEIKPENIIKAIPLHDGHMPLIAVLPFNLQIDLVKLARSRPGNYRLLSDEEASNYFFDCEYGSFPPFGEPYGLPLIVDQRVIQNSQFEQDLRLEQNPYSIHNNTKSKHSEYSENSEHSEHRDPARANVLNALPQENLSMSSTANNEIYFESGCHTSKVFMTLDDFLFLINDAIIIDCVENISSRKSYNFKSYDLQLQNEVMSLFFPELPSVARKILELKNTPLPLAVQKLSELISLDARLNANVVKFAHCYAERCKKSNVNPFKSLNESITDSIGFDSVSHFAIGISAGQLFRLPLEGHMGLNGFWRHALLAAELAQALAIKINNRTLLNPGLCHLLGLMHNFGFLLFGHLFAPEFRLLNKWMSMHPKTSVETLERKLMGMGQAQQILSFGHAHLGAWLMRFWQMPELIITSVAAHHQANYEGPYKEYVYLIQLTNHLLRGAGIGDGEYGAAHIHRLSKVLGYSTRVVHDTLYNVLNDDSFETMAMSLAT